MGKKYSAEYDKEKMAVASGKSLPVSTKHSVEIASFIRGKKLSVAIKQLEEVMDMKRAIPFKRFNKNVGHRKGRMASGRFPQKACEQILSVLKSAEANAQFKGLSTNNLVICHVCANRASTPWRFGRQKRRKSKKCSTKFRAGMTS